MMYRNKRYEKSANNIAGGTHGLIYRRIEQICGKYGPKMPDEFGNLPWDSHEEQIRNQQASLLRLWNKYRALGCTNEPKAQMSRRKVETMIDANYNPQPKEWKGTEHPECLGIIDLITSNGYH